MTVVYKLSAMRTNTENAERAIEYKYHRITPRYILVYAEKVLDKSVEINGETYDSLTESDKEWLSQCNIDILETIAESKKDVIEKSQLKFLEELDRELQKEKEGSV